MFRRGFGAAALATFVPGVLLGLIASLTDGATRSVLLLVAFILVVNAIVWAVLAFVFSRLDPPARHTAGWTPSQATVASVGPTMSRAGANPVLRNLRLAGSAVDVQVRRVTPATIVPHVRTGTVLPVRVPPGDQVKRLAIDWARARDKLAILSDPPDLS